MTSLNSIEAARNRRNLLEQLDTSIKTLDNIFYQLSKIKLNDYNDFYGVYKLIPHINGKGSYYVKVYINIIGIKTNILLIYNGSSWVFYVKKEKEYKDFLYVNMFLKNDIKNYITTEFSYIDSKNNIQKNMKNEYKIFFVTELPPTLTESLFPNKNNLVIGIENINPNDRLTANTSELITI
jgi:hypothetical protein